MKGSALKPGKPLQRKSPTARVGILASQSAARLKTAKPKPRKCKVKACRKPFEPAQPFIDWCSPDCGSILAIDKLAKRKVASARADRVETKRKLEKFKTKNQWVADVQVAFNQFIHARDKDQPCICCGKFFDAADTLTGGKWDAGHYLSRGAHPNLRFDERNVHRQIKGHNRPGGTTRAAFRDGMAVRIGLAAVEALEADHAPRHYTIDQLKAMKAEYQAKLKALKAAQ